MTRLGDRGARFTTSAPETLSQILANRESALARLKSSLPSLQSHLTELSTSTPDKSRVLYYHGLDGIKQVTYNSLKAKGELFTYELSTMDAFMSHAEAEKLRQRFVDNQVFVRTLTPVTHMDPWTDVTAMVKNWWEIRHLAPLDKPFQFEILIYNDVYAMYRYTGGEAFCVEIHSQELADQQRQLFGYLWSSAPKFQVLNDHGESQLNPG